MSWSEFCAELRFEPADRYSAIEFDVGGRSYVGRRAKRNGGVVIDRGRLEPTSYDAWMYEPENQ